LPNRLDGGRTARPSRAKAVGRAFPRRRRGGRRNGTEVTNPGVVWLLGRVIVTLSPTMTSDCWAGSSGTRTARIVDVACSTGAPPCAAAPSVAEMLVTLAALGKNTTWPSARLPVSVMPSFACSLSTAAAVAELW
jgi:hypothetical protein